MAKIIALSVSPLLETVGMILRTTSYSVQEGIIIAAWPYAWKDSEGEGLGTLFKRRRLK